MGCFTSDTKPRTEGVYGTMQEEEAATGEQEQGLVMRLEIHVACKDLKNMDVLSLTDSACVLFQKNQK